MSNHFRVHLSIVRRSRGASAVRRAAYQACAELCAPDGRVYDYSDRRERHGHVQSLLVTPEAAPEWAQNIEAIWSKAAQAEKRWDAQEARTIDLSLPHFLPRELWAACALSIAQFFVQLGMIVQVDLHAPKATNGKLNLHLHFLLTLRQISGNEFAARKERAWNRLFFPAKPMRYKLAALLNEFCHAHGIAYEADPRSNIERGLPAPEPTVPRWNLIVYKRTGERTPWLFARDEHRDARGRLAEHEQELREVKRLIRRERLLAAVQGSAPQSKIGTFMRQMSRPVRGHLEAGSDLRRRGCRVWNATSQRLLQGAEVQGPQERRSFSGP